MIQKAFLNFVLLLAAVITCGCGALHQAHEKQEVRISRLNHQDPLHIRSCGPEAIDDALRAFKISMPRSEISYEIQRQDSKLKCFISIFENGARQITWPSEIKNFFTKNDKIKGFEIIEVDDLDKLSDSDVAIVLIRKSYSLRDYHWVVYPVYSKSYIKNFYDSSTEIELIYQIKRKNE